MTRAEFLGELAALLDAPAESLAREALLAHIPGWDSTAAIGVMALLEGPVGVACHHDRVAECRTVGDVLALAGDRLAE